jgi:multiple sugar transport system permease protein
LPLNPRISAVFVGLDNYIRILGDAAFWHSLWMTFWYTALVVIGSTGWGWPWPSSLIANFACAKRHVHW